MKIILTSLLLVAGAVRAETEDILDCAAKHPRHQSVQQLDGTWRTPKFGDYQLEAAVEKLKEFPRPWTVEKVLKAYRETKDDAVRASWLSVLAASRDPRAGVELGRALTDDALVVRVAATEGLIHYFMLGMVMGGTESQMLAAQKWWAENKDRLQREAAENEMPKAQEYRLCLPYEQLVKLADDIPTPVECGVNPGRLRDGKPWSGTFVWSSHKTTVIVEEYEGGQRDGVSLGYYSKNIKHWEGHYIKGVKDGVVRIWDATGRLCSTETYHNGVREGDQ